MCALFMAWRGVAQDSALYTARFSERRRCFAKPACIGGSGSSHGPALADFGGQLLMAWRGIGNEARIHVSRLQAPGEWLEHGPLPDAVTSHRPALASFQGKLHLAWKGAADFSLWHASSLDGVTWSRRKLVPNVGSSQAPSLAVQADKLVMFWKGIEGDAAIWTSSFNGRSWAPQSRFVGATSCSPAAAPFFALPLVAWKGVDSDQGIYSLAGLIPGVGTSCGPSLAVRLRNYASLDRMIPLPEHTLMAWKGVYDDPCIYFAELQEGSFAWTPQRSVQGALTCDTPALAFSGEG